MENAQSPHDAPVVRIEVQLAMKKVESTLSFENQMYRVGIPWKSDAHALPDNYKMTLKRKENTEKRLKKSQDVEQAYNKSAAGMQHTPPRDIFNAKKIIFKLDLFMQSLKKISENAKDRE